MLQRLDNEHPYQAERLPGYAQLIYRAGHVFLAACRTIRIWADRAKKRRQLAQMSQREIKDIGAGRSDVVREINKRFWEA